MISRRKLFGLLAAGAVVTSADLLSHRTIFLPPRGGWPNGRLAALIIPRTDAYMWEPEIAAGKVKYDVATETMSLLEPIDAPPTPEWAASPPIKLDERGSSIFSRAGTTPLVFHPGIQEREMAPIRARTAAYSTELIEKFGKRAEALDLAAQPLPNPEERARAARRAAEIRAQMEIDRRENREKMIALYREIGWPIPERYLVESVTY